MPLLGAPAKPPPPPLGHPPLSDSVVLPVPEAGLNAGNTGTIANAPAPHGGRAGVRGAVHKTNIFFRGRILTTFINLKIN